MATKPQYEVRLSATPAPFSPDWMICTLTTFRRGKLTDMRVFQMERSRGATASWTFEALIREWVGVGPFAATLEPSEVTPA